MADYTGRRVYPVAPDMTPELDQGTITHHMRTGLPRGGPTSPHNSNVRGLSKRADEPLK